VSGLAAIRDRHNLVAILPDHGPQASFVCDCVSDPMEAEFMLKWIDIQQGMGRNVYFHANPVEPSFSGMKASKADIQTCTHAQLDLDPDADPGIPFDQRRQKVLEKMNFIRRTHPPSVIIDSGNGFNLLWELETPLSVEDYEPKNNVFNSFYKAHGTFNADRILKVPGTVAFSGRTKILKGYPAVSQARLVNTGGVTTTFEKLPMGSPKSSTTTAATKGSSIPVPGGISSHEENRLRDIILKDANLRTSLKPNSYADKSRALVAVAGACVRANLDRLDFASIVTLATKSDAHAHLMNQQDKDRALGRAWDEAVGPKGREEFGRIDSPSAVPVPKPKTPDEMDDSELSAVLESQSDVYKAVPPAKRVYIEELNLEGVRLLAGAQKMGKSWLILQEAQHIADGSPVFLGQKVMRGRVLYAGFEDGKNRIHNRLHQLQIQPNRDINYWFDPEENAELNLCRLVNLRRVFPFDVVYIDTLKWWSGTATARHGTAYDQSVEDIKPLIRYANAHGISLTFTTHLKKDKRGLGDWQDMVQGSIGAMATASSILMLDRRRGMDDAVLHRSGRDFMDEEDIAIRWEGMPNGWTLSASPAQAVLAKVHTRQGSAKQKVLDHLMKHGPTSRQDLVMEAGGGRSQVYGAVNALQSDGVVAIINDIVALA
jgi:hypothetical protein